MKTVFLLLILLDCLARVYAFGNEVDHFTRRYERVADSNAELSREMNLRIARAVVTTNQSAKGCSRAELFKNLKKNLFTPLYGSPLEFYADRAAEVSKLSVDHMRSIYEVDPEMPNASSLSWKTKWQNPGLYLRHPSPLIRIGTQTIGIDKFGHFLSMGWRYYIRGVNQKTGKLLPGGMEKVLAYGQWTERVQYGAAVSGVFSYADLATNLEGFRFWRSLLDRESAETPYIQCVNQKFSVSRAFNWEDYVSVAWDEGMNCSKFTTPAVRETVLYNQRELTRRTGLNHVCPIEPRNCTVMKNHYGSLAKDVISPSCDVHSVSGAHIRH